MGRESKGLPNKNLWFWATLPRAMCHSVSLCEGAVIHRNRSGTRGQQCTHSSVNCDKESKLPAGILASWLYFKYLLGHQCYCGHIARA